MPSLHEVATFHLQFAAQQVCPNTDLDAAISFQIFRRLNVVVRFLPAFEANIAARPCKH